MKIEGQKEALAMLVEELGETVQAVGKYLRHGPVATDNHPEGEGRTYDNAAALGQELWDVQAVVLLAQSVGILAVYPAVFTGRSYSADVILREKLLKRLPRIHDEELRSSCGRLLVQLKLDIDMWEK